jgi:hypothetical protein
MQAFAHVQALCEHVHGLFPDLTPELLRQSKLSSPEPAVSVAMWALVAEALVSTFMMTEQHWAPEELQPLLQRVRPTLRVRGAWWVGLRG